MGAIVLLRRGLPAALAASTLLVAAPVAGQAQVQCEVDTLTMDNAEQGDEFAESLSASGDYVVVGEPDGIINIGPGAAHVFRRDGMTWLLEATLTASDGADLDSAAGFYDALGAARAASVPIFPVPFGYASDDPALKSRLGELARATGGRMIENSTPDRLAEAYDDVVALLRAFYLIGYVPGPGGEAEGTLASGRARWHDVRVQLRRPNFETLVRPGYYR